MSGFFLFLEVGEETEIAPKSGQECNREGRPLSIESFNRFAAPPTAASIVGPSSISNFTLFISSAESSAGLPTSKLFDKILSAFSSQSAVLCIKVIVFGVTSVPFLCGGMPVGLPEVGAIPLVNDGSADEFRFVSSCCVSTLRFQFW